ncbi:MAG: hypothetical protein H6810_01755 [Phycisphaeraceae bacterium]|nr:MAG: hypothetical protein H6810_01755 [Phycisphaeraceae bacterium]
MKTLSIIAIAGLASAAAADNYLTANAAYGGHAPHARSNYASATMTVAVDYDHWDANLSPNNIVVFIDLNAALGGLAGQDAYVTGIGWDTHIMTVASGSWLSESAYDFAGQIFLSPGAGDSFSGTGDYSSGGIVDLSDNGLPDILAAGGVLSLEMFDSFDDVAGAVDSHQSGTLTLVVDYKVPAPAGLAVLGLGGLVATRRRR